MAKLLRMPEVAANATEAVLQDWTVTVNSQFAAEDPIATVETEKAVVDVEAEEDGVVLKTLVPSGARVEVGSPIAVLGAPGEQVDDLDALLSELGVVTDPTVAAAERQSPAGGAEGGTVSTDDADTVPASSGTGPSGGVGSAAVGTRAIDNAGRVFASPLARRLAREAGLSVDDLEGTGPGGRIVRRDVEAASGGGDVATASTWVPPTAQGGPRPERRLIGGPPPSAGRATEHTEIPHSRMRRAIADRVTESKQAIPHFYLRGTAHVHRLLDLRSELNEAGEVKISINDLVIKAAARAHTLVPAMNVVWTPGAMRSFSAVDVSVAVATDNGLMTPVLRAVDAMSISSVAIAVQDFVERAQAGHLRQEELEGGSLSITNLGMFGIEEFAAIISPPQSAILAVGAAMQEPVVENGALTIGTVMRVTLSVDHRAIDGVLAAKWMTTFLGLLEQPVRILA